MNRLSFAAVSPTRPALLAALLTAFACSSSESATPSGPAASDGGAAATPDGASDATDASAPGVTACVRKAVTGDRVRAVIVSHPSDQNGEKATDYEIIHLGLDGKLARDGAHFTMGRNFNAPIFFSPDGEIGIAVQDDDGSLGIFRMTPSGTADVVAAKFGKESFYADAAVFSADGSRLFIADSNRKTTGGIHEVEIACDGTPTYRGRIFESPGSTALRLLPTSSKLLVSAASAPGAAADHDIFLLDVASRPVKLESSTALFGDGNAIAKGLDVTPDGKVGLVSDANEFLGTNRVGVVSLATGLTKVAVLDIEGPSGVVVSPYGNTALVTAAGGGSIDAFYVLSLAPSGMATSGGKFASLMGAKPQLPTSPVVVGDGTLKGLILVAEVEGVRRLRFEPNGGVTDLGVFTLQGGLEASVGSVGVQP